MLYENHEQNIQIRRRVLLSGSSRKFKLAQKRGWNFIRVKNPLVYFFEKCLPDIVLFRLLKTSNLDAFDYILK